MEWKLPFSSYVLLAGMTQYVPYTTTIKAVYEVKRETISWKKCVDTFNRTNVTTHNVEKVCEHLVLQFLFNYRRKQNTQ